MVHESPRQGFAWKKVLIATSLGTLLLIVGTAAYDRWRVSQGWCIKFSPDGSQKVFYGDDCGK